MMSSLPILQKNYKFSKVFYWGKLQGVKGEYLIAMGIEESFEAKKFFFWYAGRPRRSDARCRVCVPVPAYLQLALLRH